MAKKEEPKVILEEEPKGFSKIVKFVQPFDGELDLGGKARFRFKVTRRDLYPKQPDGSYSKIKKPVEKEITNEAVYNWLKQFEAVNA